MYHFFVLKEQIGPHEIIITGGDVNHIRSVLRMKPGEKIGISDGEENEYCCEIVHIAEDQVRARILSEEKDSRELPARLYLFQGLPKSDKMELIIQKAVELGVYQVIPVVTRRTIVKLDSKKEEARIKRWNTIAESAAKQSGRGIIPQVTEVMTFDKALALAETFQVKIIPFEHAVGMADTKRELERIRPGTDAGFFIGPEGGFEEEEIVRAEGAGVKAVSLGRRILRTETAGLMVLSVAGYLLETERENICCCSGRSAHLLH
ncbi:MAG: 16S rRNA (uracil(1498)-N(3))-methyltransferase [Hungatella sp.]|nr:16S rRNA (uracil(1498)-N(3))-methyltransferase [Hungatella sp.]